MPQEPNALLLAAASGQMWKVSHRHLSDMQWCYTHQYSRIIEECGSRVSESFVDDLAVAAVERTACSCSTTAAALSLTPCQARRQPALAVSNWRPIRVIAGSNLVIVFSLSSHSFPCRCVCTALSCLN